MTKAQLIHELIDEGYLRTPLLIKAFEKVDRKDFVPAALMYEAYQNCPLPIGYGQTISQPLTVAFMLELLSVKTGNRVLEIGTGSGWQTALLAYLTGTNGEVVGIERIPELEEMTKKNIKKYKELNARVKILLGDGSKKVSNETPFERIIVGASAENVPQIWLEQLSLEGVLVAPIGNSVLRLTKNDRGGIEREEYRGFIFVPLICGS
ncbi:MAG: protein-L-isoaspartate(D-aspartate) O-methyltransferase [Candidatus Colwellbacteria bacterium]|nr:protein-L-isoaspartate(D-aspartate) O-methyltransferase [Candidatus Colwellbacteria bacterium]